MIRTPISTLYALVTLALLSLGITAATAADIAPASPFTIGLEIYRETYTERTEEDQKFMQEEATMYAMYAAYTVALNDKNSLLFKGIYGNGATTYTGAYQGEPYGSLTTNGHYRNILDMRALYSLTPSDATPLSYIAGIGWRKLDDHLNETGPSGYLRESRYIYATAGLLSQHAIGQWRFTPQVYYHHLLHGEQRSYLRGPDNPIINKQPKGYGLEISITANPGGTGLTNNMHFKPFFRYWHIADSEVVQLSSARGFTRLMEPRNTTTEIGMHVSLSF